MAEPRNPHIASVGKAFTALITIAERQEPTTVKDLSAIMGSPLPTTYHLINTLLAEGALVKGDKHGYLLGPRIGALADAYFEQGEPLDRLEGPLRDLAAQTGETAYLSAWRHGDIEVVATAEGSHAVRVAQLQRGTHGHAHARASGKLLLAFARPGLRDEYLRNHRLDALTSNTITNRGKLDEDLELARTRGYATDIEEFALDVSCVAAPILSAGHILGTYTLSCPSHRFERDSERLIQLVVASAHAAEGAVLSAE